MKQALTTAVPGRYVKTCRVPSNVCVRLGTPVRGQSLEMMQASPRHASVSETCYFIKLSPTSV